jgi:hypothetical protein
VGAGIARPPVRLDLDDATSADAPSDIAPAATADEIASEQVTGHIDDVTLVEVARLRRVEVR